MGGGSRIEKKKQPLLMELILIIQVNINNTK